MSDHDQAIIDLLEIQLMDFMIQYKEPFDRTILRIVLGNFAAMAGALFVVWKDQGEQPNFLVPVTMIETIINSCEWALNKAEFSDN